ncbi:hypothetical protein D3C86_1811040 [compost metagenome]
MNTCTTTTEIIAVVGVRSQFGPSMPTTASMPLMPPLACSRKLQTMVQATSDTTTGEKNRVRNTTIPLSFWSSSTASSRASDMLSTTSPAEKMADAVSTAGRFGSASSIW